ncbi:hypothetical protein ABT133_18190 [Streptomyces sp. NPDC001835]|uniref:MmyB family transcriptional regulator n=1 Tax=Streptomyces sp. NPDC001835 TaxID=3154528 RepID=UPI00331CED1B
MGNRKEVREFLTSRRAKMTPGQAGLPAGSRRRVPGTWRWPSCAARPAATRHDKALHDLVGELSTRCEGFRTRWGAHDVRRHGTGTKRFRHPAVGDLTLAYEALDLAAEPGLSMTVCTAEPGSPSEEGLRLLASLAATEHASPAAGHPAG